MSKPLVTNPYLLFVISYPSLVLAPVCVVVAMIRWHLFPRDRRRTDAFFCFAVLVLPALVLCESVAIGMSRLVPFKLDLYIAAIDGRLGFQPSFFIGVLVVRHVWLFCASVIAYGGLPMAMLAVYAAYLWRRPAAETVRLLQTFAVAFLGGVVLFLLCPVCGPRYAFGAQFPFHAPAAIVAHPVAIAAPPNGVPSLHMTAALLILWFARHWIIGRLLAVVFLVLTVVAALGAGEHYLFDLIVAVPYSVAVCRCLPHLSSLLRPLCVRSTRFTARRTQPVSVTRTSVHSR
jgi:PAP2 superfamily